MGGEFGGYLFGGIGSLRVLPSFLGAGHRINTEGLCGSVLSPLVPRVEPSNTLSLFDGGRGNNLRRQKERGLFDCPRSIFLLPRPI